MTRSYNYRNYNSIVKTPYSKYTLNYYVSSLSQQSMRNIYLFKVGIKYTYTLPFPNSTCEIVLGFFLTLLLLVCANNFLSFLKTLSLHWSSIIFFSLAKFLDFSFSLISARSIFWWGVRKPLIIKRVNSIETYTLSKDFCGSITSKQARLNYWIRRREGQPQTEAHVEEEYSIIAFFWGPKQINENLYQNTICSFVSNWNQSYSSLPFFYFLLYS